MAFSTGFGICINGEKTTLGKLLVPQHKPRPWPQAVGVVYLTSRHPQKKIPVSLKNVLDEAVKISMLEFRSFWYSVRQNGKRS